MDKHLRDADPSVHIYISEKDGDIQTQELFIKNVGVKDRTLH